MESTTWPESQTEQPKQQSQPQDHPNEESPKVNEHSTYEIIMSIDEANKKCIDCGSEFVNFISVNNGVTLCDNCAITHRSFGNSISFIREIKDKTDSYLLNFIVLGSNSKFSRSMEVLGLSSDLSQELKYKTFACDYYRRNLKAKVQGIKPIDIDFTKPNDIIESPIDSFPEFQNYTIKTEKQGITEEKPENTGKKIVSFFSKFGKKIVNTGKNIGTTVKNLQIADKVKAGGNKTVEGLKKAGTFIAVTSAPATNKIKQGAHFVGTHVKTAYDDIKQKIIPSEKKENQENKVVININDGDDDQKDNPKEDEADNKQSNLNIEPAGTPLGNNEASETRDDPKGEQQPMTNEQSDQPNESGK